MLLYDFGLEIYICVDFIDTRTARFYVAVTIMREQILSQILLTQ